MIIVTRGKVDGKPVGSEVCGLTEAQEERLVALGVAEYASAVGDAGGCAAAADGAACDDLSELTADQLKEMCHGYGLPVTGKKADLIARIAECERAWDEGACGEPDAEGGADEAPELTAQAPE